MTPTIPGSILADAASQAQRAGDAASQAPRAPANARSIACLPPASSAPSRRSCTPPAIFLDMSGEEVRRRLFLTADAAGEELCLRPEYTIPVCRAYLASGQGRRDRRIFLSRPGFPRPARARAASRRRPGSRASAAATPKRPTRKCSRSPWRRRLRRAGPRSRRGSATPACSTPCSNSLKIPEPWRRRLRRGVARGLSLEAIFSRPSQSALAQPGVLAALESADHAGAKALVEDLLAIAGIDAVGGRTPSEIADRFLEQASLRSGPPIEAEKRAVLDAFLAISGDPDQAAVELRRLAHSAGLDLSAALDAFERRNGFIAARGVAIEATRFSAAFVRDFDYYTGFVFEAHDPHVSGREDRARRRALRRARPAPRRERGHSRRRRGDQSRPARQRGRALMGAHPATAPKAPFVLAVPSKGRLQEAAHAFFARAGLELVQGRGARDYRGAIAGLAGRRGRLCLVGRDRRPACGRSRAFRRRRRGSRAREGRRRRGAARAFEPARLRPRQCRGRRAQGLDRRAHHGRSRRRRRRPFAPSAASGCGWRPNTSI